LPKGGKEKWEVRSGEIEVVLRQAQDDGGVRGLKVVFKYKILLQ